MAEEKFYKVKDHLYYVDVETYTTKESLMLFQKGDPVRIVESEWWNDFKEKYPKEIEDDGLEVKTVKVLKEEV